MQDRRGSPKSQAGEPLDEEQRRQIQEVVDRQRGQPGSLIPTLEEVQAIVGYLPREALLAVAKGLALPLSQVTGVATFYSYFALKPRGRHQLKVCLGTACHVRGAQRTLDRLRETLDLKPGECTEDRLFGLDVVRCLGACGLAPVMMLDQETHRQVDGARLEELLAPLRHSADDGREGCS